MPIILAMTPNQWPLTFLKGIDNLVLMAINFTLLYIFCPLFQGSVACTPFCFLFRSNNDQQLLLDYHFGPLLS